MFDWLTNLIGNAGIAQSVLLTSVTIVGGLCLSKLKFKGISLGVTWILFFGIFIGQFDFIQLDEHILHFIKEFGLILFVYSIGLQVGPGFFSSFQNEGVKLNLLAFGIVLFGGIIAYAQSQMFGIDLASMVGIMSGAVTNTPGLGAAQQTYSDIHGTSADILSAGYAIAYPMGVVGVLLVCILLKKLCKSADDVVEEKAKSTVDMFSIEIHNPSCDNIKLEDLRKRLSIDFVITRIFHTKTQFVEIPNNDSILNEGDKIFVVCKKEYAQAIELCTGRRIEMDMEAWSLLDKQLTSKKLTVTRTELQGKSMKELDFIDNFNVNISRIIRADVSIFPADDTKVVLGDILVAVGNEKGIQKAAAHVGNKKVNLSNPFLIPIFLGILLGIILGSIPFALPGIPVPVKLGLAGGPLIVAILMSRFGTQLGIITYATHSAKKLMQEMGISLFLAAVGLTSGKVFFATLMEHGATWGLYGTLITVIPITLMVIIGRYLYKFKPSQLMGLISGGMTDPAALAFANSLSDGRASLSYATVYPLTMFLRILCAQVLILLSI